MGGLVALATEVGPPTNYESIIGQITSTMNTSSITSVLTFALPTAVGMVFLWWAVRKVAGIIKRAFMRGKLRF